MLAGPISTQTNVNQTFAPAQFCKIRHTMLYQYFVKYGGDTGVTPVSHRWHPYKTLISQNCFAKMTFNCSFFNATGGGFLDS